MHWVHASITKMFIVRIYRIEFPFWNDTKPNISDKAEFRCRSVSFKKWKFPSHGVVVRFSVPIHFISVKTSYSLYPTVIRFKGARSVERVLVNATVSTLFLIEKLWPDLWQAMTCKLVVIWTTRNTFQLKLNQNRETSNQDEASEYALRNTSPILHQPPYVNKPRTAMLFIRFTCLKYPKCYSRNFETSISM